ncbi:hypothetical protein GCM10017673_19870 [Streptosporangium violaceochromogenes]|nr:hypothetical protein GCM10017673_19870 [Streptosporangium violaceochromogenes]
MIAALLLAALVTGCGEGTPVYDLGVIVHGSAGKTSEVRLSHGKHFSLAVNDSPSVGDSWRMSGRPDARVASFVSEEYEGVSGVDGVHYFVFSAKDPGTTTVTLSDCENCPPGVPMKVRRGRGEHEPGNAVFRVTVV